MRTLDLELDVYQGPFDLLLSLVLKEEIDLLEVPLLDIILAYLDQMEAEGTHDYWDDMTEFLLLMSLLVEVKSRLLLPGASLELDGELTPEEARDQLLTRLFEYSKFKSASESLRHLAELNCGAIMRPPAGDSRRRLPPLEEIAGSGDVMELRDGLVRLLDSKRQPDAAHLAQIKVDLRRQISIVRGVLARRGHFSFDTVFGGEEPLVQAVSLFALLNLLAKGEIRVSQARAFGDITVRVAQDRKTA
ncbi:MAG: segregation/condensation protein A [Actinobacteria bacterium]|nr:segregation/condensation protein A [Actinomycetota bacterium]